MTDKPLCACCGIRPRYRHRSLCAQCVAALKAPPPHPEQQHLELLQATGRDYDD